MKRIAKGSLPEVSEEGFFELFNELTIFGNTYPKGTVFKRIHETKTGKTWTIRRKQANDRFAFDVRSELLKKQ